MHDLVILRRLKASPRAVWRALTVPEEVNRWAAGTGKFDIVSGEHAAHDRYHLVMRSSDGASMVTLEVTRAGDASELLLRHDGFESAALRNRCGREWQARIRRLARYVEVK